MKSTRRGSDSPVHRPEKTPRLQVHLDKWPLSPGTRREACGVPCLDTRRGLTLRSPVCRDPAIGVGNQRYPAVPASTGDEALFQCTKPSGVPTPTVKELCEQFIEEYSKPRNKPRTVDTYQGYIDRHIIPALGKMKVPDLTRADITALMRDKAHIAVTANRILACLRKMLNMAEVWGYRPDGSNPCRHVPKYREDGETRYIVNDELARLYAYLDRADAEGLEHPTLTLAIRLQFEFSARMIEIRTLEWAWVDFENRRVVWPDSKTGDISKPMSEAAYQLLSNAPRINDSPYVCPAVFDSNEPLPESTYYNSWRRILERARVPHVGTHGIRHRAATDIANSGVPIKVGMALTAHKTVTQFMTYVHTEDDPVRAAAEKVANLRRAAIDSRASATPTAQPLAACPVAEGEKTRTGQGNYRPYRHRKSPKRAVPPGTKRAAPEAPAAASS